MKKTNLKSWFTLIELIVVIAIIWFLWMVGVMTFMEWFWKSRDASRVAALQNMSTALETHLASHTSYPLPDNYITVKYSWEDLSYQGYFWSTVANSISNIKSAPKDPKDDKYYTYALSQDKKHYELLALMEWWDETVSYNPLVSEVYADSSYTDRIPRVFWDPIWIWLDSNNTPLQYVQSNSIDMYSSWDGEYKLVMDDNTIKSWTWNVIVWNQFWLKFTDTNYKNCNDIKVNNQDFSTWNWIYLIKPDGASNAIKVYCNMKHDSWAWTLYLVSLWNNWQVADSNDINSRCSNYWLNAFTWTNWWEVAKDYLDSLGISSTVKVAIASSDSNVSWLTWSNDFATWQTWSYTWTTNYVLCWWYNN